MGVIIYMKDGNALASVEDGVVGMCKTINIFYMKEYNKKSKNGRYTAMDVSSLVVWGREEMLQIYRLFENLLLPRDKDMRFAWFGETAQAIVYILGGMDVDVLANEQ